MRTTWRLALDRRRGDKRREAREQRDAPARIGIGEAGSARDEPVDDLVARERAAHLWRAIDALPEKLRVVVVLANIEGHDVGAVARLLRLPAGTVKSRLFLARRLWRTWRTVEREYDDCYSWSKRSARSSWTGRRRVAVMAPAMAVIGAWD